MGLAAQDKNLTGTQVHAHNLHVVGDVVVVQNPGQHGVAVQTVVQVVVQNRAVVQDVLQDAHIVLIQHIIQTHQLHVGIIQGIQVQVVQCLRLDILHQHVDQS